MSRWVFWIAEAIVLAEVIVLVWVGLGCDVDAAAGTVARDGCAELAAASCARLEACAPATDEPACVVAAERRISGGRVCAEVDALALERCLGDVRALPCDALVSPASCTSLIEWRP